MDLMPGPEIYEAAARAWAANSMAAVHGDWSARDQWPARLQDNENLHRIVDTVWSVAYRAGREDAAREIAGGLCSYHGVRDGCRQLTMPPAECPDVFDQVNQPRTPLGDVVGNTEDQQQL